MAHIHFIITGGTIDSVYHAPTETSVPAQHSMIEEYLKTIQPHIKLTFETICMLDSGDITNKTRHDMIEAVKNTDANKIIICHGTNTMIETAQYIENNITNNQKTIIMTGSMIPLKQFVMSDAGFNLGYAIAQSQNIERGTYICMNAKTFPAEMVKKNRTIARFEDF